MQQKLSKIIKQLNKENAPPDGWKPEDRVSNIYEIRVAIQNFLTEKLNADVTDAGTMLDGSGADFAFIFEGKRYEVNIDNVTEEEK